MTPRIDEGVSETDAQEPEAPEAADPPAGVRRPRVTTPLELTRAELEAQRVVLWVRRDRWRGEAGDNGHADRDRDPFD